MKISYGQKKWGKKIPWMFTRGKCIRSTDRVYGYVFRASPLNCFKDGELLMLEKVLGKDVKCVRVSDGLEQYVDAASFRRC